MAKMMLSLGVRDSRAYIKKPARRRLTKEKRTAKRAARRADRQVVKAGHELETSYALTELDIS